MNRLTTGILAVVGIIVAVVGAIPSGLARRLNGVGGSGHITADVLVGIGGVVFLVGVYGLLPRLRAT
jgi:hypothetical protein